MSEKILLVDDDQNLLESLRLNLRKKYYIDTAQCAEKGLEFINKGDPYSVVVSDLRMPEMDGIEFLTKVQSLSSDTVRIMLSGNADFDAAITAVNEGRIFRFLTKPCPPSVFVPTLDAALEQYRLVTAEKELLRGTLRGSIKVLSELLAQLNPEAFGRGQRILPFLRELINVVKPPNVWCIELAAMLSQIGSASIPERILRRVIKGKEVLPQEYELYNKHPEFGAKLIANIPRMEEVATIIHSQNERFDCGRDLPLGARMLKIVLDYDSFLYAGVEGVDALEKLNSKDRKGWYDPTILLCFEKVMTKTVGHTRRNLRILDMKENMVLDQNILSKNGVILMTRGQQITATSLVRLINFANTSGIREPIATLIPYEKDTGVGQG